MKILFGTTHYMKDTSEVPSGFLVWIIEEYSAADWTLIQACKQELASRLKLDFVPPPQPFTKAEQVDLFKTHLLDELYRKGLWSEAGLKQVDPNWMPPEDKVKVGDTIVAFLKRIEELKDKVEWYDWIVKAHGINLNYFRKLGRTFAASLYFRTQREGSYRLPDAFADNELQKSPFNLFTLIKPEPPQ